MTPRKKNLSPPKTESLKFEDAIERVEAVVDQIESGEIGLEESLAEYERATKMIGRCRSILSAAQKKIALLTQDDQGRLSVAESDADEQAKPSSD